MIQQLIELLAWAGAWGLVYGLALLAHRQSRYNLTNNEDLP